MSSIPHTHMASVSPWSNTSPSFLFTMRSAGIVLGITIPIVFLLIGAGVSIYLRRDAARERRENQTLPRAFVPIDKEDEPESSIPTMTRPRCTRTYANLMTPFSSSFWRKSSYNEDITKIDCHSPGPSRQYPDKWSPIAFFGRNLPLSHRTSEIDPERASVTTNPRTSPSTNPLPTPSHSYNLNCESRLSLPLPTVACTRSRSVSL